MTTTTSHTERFAQQAAQAIPVNGDDYRQCLVDRILNLPHVMTASAVDDLICYSTAAKPNSPEEDALLLLVANAIAELPEAEQADLQAKMTDRIKWADMNRDCLRNRLWDLAEELTR